MKPGEKIAVRATLEWCSANAQNCRARTERSDFAFNGHEAIPDSPMLPAVSRWLAEHNDALVYGQHTPGDWIDVIDAYADETDDLMDRMSLTVSVIPALRSLIAALSEGQA